MAEKLYLFKDKYYIQCDVETFTVEGSPRPMADDWFGDVSAASLFKGSTPESIDPVVSAIAYCDNASGCFRNDLLIFFSTFVAVVDPAKNKTLFAAPLGDCINDLPKLFQYIPDGSGIDAARILNGKLHLFKGDRFCSSTMSQENIDSGRGYPLLAVCQGDSVSNISTMPHLLPGFTDNFDAVVSIEQESRTMLFKGSDVLLYYKKSNVQPISAIWKGTEKFGFDRDIQAAVVLPKELMSFRNQP